ncbi:MAG: phosphatase PAP2 family protein [Nitrospirae bacterium]|nr:MAG: phosphatase PAP2 family protein [Nitrospirota bacterium]
MPLRKWFESANYAIEGVLHAAKTERHLRYHFYAASAVLILSFLLGVSRAEFLLISIMAVIVICAELLNTAIEHVVDLLSPEKNELARLAKDIAAGAVLVTAFGSLVIGYIILAPYIYRAFQEGFTIAKHTGEDTAVVSLVIVLILVIITKSHFGLGRPLRGGLPSGHSALAFSIWVSTTYISQNYIVSILTFVAALVIAQSRVAVKAHTAWEVILGGLLGSITTFVLFLIFY